MTASLALVMFCGWLLVFRHKNIRTKGYHWFLNVYANEFATHSLINVFAPVVLSFQLFLLNMNIRFFLLFLLRMLCFALTNYVCMMNVWQKRHEHVHVRAAWCSSLCILMFFCSYVFIYSCILHTWNLDPWSWPGMTVSLALAMFCGCLLVFRQKNIRTKGLPLILECLCKWICDTFFN